MSEQARVAAVDQLERELSELFAQTRRLFQEAAARVHPDLLPGTFKLLSMISRRAPITSSALAEALALDKAQISRAVKQLTDLGLVQVEPDPTDGRVKLLSVTEAGRVGVRDALSPLRERFRGTLDQWPVEDISSLGTLLHELTRGATRL